MAEDINPAVIKFTQETLGKYVKKPHLTEKLLKKPPFRFLHDVFAVVIRDTGCFEGLYTSEELNSENIKDREDKMRFLQKMIDVVRICTNVPVTAKTSKIVAGHEPEKTNELLQLMGKIIENKLNWQPAVEQVLKGKEPKTSEKSKEKEKTKDKEATKTKDPSKASKTTNKVSKQPSVNKEDKVKRPKDKDKTTKEKTSTKSNKVEEKPTMRKSKEAAVTKKLAKTDSQSSNKSISPNKELKTKKKIETAQPPAQCSHEEESQIMGETIRKTSITRETKADDVEAVSKEIIQQNEDVMGPTTNQEEQTMLSLSGLGKTSAKSRKASLTTENNDMSPPQREENGGSRKTPGKSRKSAQMRDNAGMSPKNEGSNSRKSSGKNKKPPKAEETNEMSPQRQDNNNRKSSSAKAKKPIDLNSHDENSNDQPLMEKENRQPVQTSKIVPYSPEKNINSTETSLKTEQQQPPIPTNAEVKRESTFTRENSKDLPNKTNNRPRTSLRPPSARPPSARPGAPRRRDRNIEIILQPNDQIKMSGIQVKLENFGDLDDDGENLVIIENTDTANDDLSINGMGGGAIKPEAGLDNETMEQQGHLVQQILETQKELTQQKDFNQQIKNDKDSVNGMVMKQTSMNNLRDVIQGLTKSINPLGKLMDFIPEDIDAMQLEFTMWRDTYTQAANQLKREKSLTESATEPMKNQLLQIESNIQEYMEMIDASRVKILQNNDKILKMLTTS